MSAAAVRFGVPDKASIYLIKSFQYGLMFSPAVETTPELTEFMIERYFINGAALYGRESDDELREVNEVSRYFSPNLREVYDLVEYYVHRARLYSRITGLGGLLKNAHVVPFGPDDRAEHPCREHAGRIVDCETTARRINNFRRLPHENYADDVFDRDLGFPPFRIGCRCVLEGVISELE